MDLVEAKITKMNNVLDDMKNKNQRAIVQEELLLNQLKEEFDIDNLEEGYELYDQLIDEKEDRKKRVANQTESLYTSIVSEGLIDVI
jgi:TolA-binding protein